MDRARARLVYTLVLVVGFLTVCPVAMLALGSFSEGLTAFGQFTVDKYVDAYTDPALLDVMLNTVIFVLGSSVLATVLALFLAYLNTRTDIPFKFLFGVLSIIPMMIPHLLFSVSWALLLNPSNGMVNVALRNAFGLEGAPFDVYTLGGMILVEGLLDLPIAYLIIAPAMASFDVALEESSRVCGAGTWRTLVRITENPAESHRPAEAVRIAAGIGGWKKTEVDLLLEGPAARLLSPWAEEFVDGENYRHYLPILREWKRPVSLAPGAERFEEIEEATLPVAWLDAEGVAALRARATHQILF